ncbi:heat-inducible transcriptional repressor HrcA [Cohnella sp. CFH 77786]|uniref:heat-inducible transcriptional repressor HrcA n=1 Tax=Cohnella sp. CFH 77786 TaxID=2662265 RepID=UPI001C60B41A|nr:heat-inducible transcriptional repressor HrcA [Cohnella sp. CFH 77786]MBW5444922.1 heat-inducible transcriptional repressor HrcA [Cohnella sp. CFH 77786]
MLSERQRMILTAIVDDYIRSAEPVGSRSISKRGDVSFSPATIRNEMADLEELGFLEQPHTSAGRIPSHKGYRYYVDHLIAPGGVREEDIRKIRAFFAEKMIHWEDVIGHAATILSHLTNYTSIVLGPEMFSASLKHFQLVPLNDSSAVAIIVTNTGHVEHRTMTIPEGIDVGDLGKIVGLLNDKLVGVPFHRVKSVLYSEIARELGRYMDRCEEILSVLEQSIEEQKDPRVFLSGAANMLAQPEFKDVDKAKLILDTLEETGKLTQLFPAGLGGIQVKIGTENAMEAINQCSLITANYTVDGQSLGTIGILGPTRMEYGKVIGLLEFLSRDIASMLNRRLK